MSDEEKVRAHKDMTPNDLRRWRSQQPGDYAYKNNQRKQGWSQVRAAEWYGVNERQWRRYETGTSAIPLPLVKRLIAYGTSFDDTVARLWETTDEKIEEQGGSVFPQLAHEGIGGT